MFERSKAFYAAALAPLGLEVLVEPVAGAACGFGSASDHKPFFWITTRDRANRNVHLAFASPDRATVDAFHLAALAAGGIDNGPPGMRPHYHSGYYGAFVLDPDGNNVEAVTHRGH